MKIINLKLKKMTIEEIQKQNFKALVKAITNALKDETKTREELKKVYVKYDNKIEVFHLNGLINDKQLAKLDSFIFDICENILYGN